MPSTAILASPILTVSESNDGEFSTFRFGSQFAMVYED